MAVYRYHLPSRLARGRSVSAHYAQLSASFKAFEEKEIEAWLESIDLKFAEKLKVDFDISINEMALPAE